MGTGRGGAPEPDCVPARQPACRRPALAHIVGDRGPHADHVPQGDGPHQHRPIEAAVTTPISYAKIAPLVQDHSVSTRFCWVDLALFTLFLLVVNQFYYRSNKRPPTYDEAWYLETSVMLYDAATHAEWG